MTPPVPGLAAFNALPAAQAQRQLLDCCAAPRWAARVVAGRPYPDRQALFGAADRALTDGDLDEAMAGHPRIGDRAEGPSRREQAAAAGAPADVLAALADGNRDYEKRFGYVYLVCASGRSAPDLLATLRARLAHDPATERAVARAELVAINRIRLDRLLAGEPV